ncbi:transposase [Polymorphospora rubra]|uniref:Transposase n=1 Tax=Polymorphospora rubra TaxID=338584 RepID=A0A810N8I4_9ACTN|nr:transposase [Polymorphospora rubra]BCJ69340.1 hypothetical protein Prubr_63610 [Polymorphospora rubra]
MTIPEADDLPAPHSFDQGCAPTHRVVAGLPLPHGNGPVEGADTKVRILGRQMCGKTGFALLRRRILLA